MRDGLIRDLEAIAQSPGHTGRIIGEAAKALRDYERVIKHASNAQHQLSLAMEPTLDEIFGDAQSRVDSSTG